MKRQFSKALDDFIQEAQKAKGQRSAAGSDQNDETASAAAASKRRRRSETLVEDFRGLRRQFSAELTKLKRQAEAAMGLSRSDSTSSSTNSDEAPSPAAHEDAMEVDEDDEDDMVVDNFHVVNDRIITWDDVHGAEDVKKQVSYFFLALQNPSAWCDAVPRNHLLLAGSPGTGKTSAVRAISHQATSTKLESAQTITFFAPTGADLFTAAKVRKLFKDARDRAPSIVFIDECEKAFSGDSHRVQELKILLDKQPRNVLLVCATNETTGINTAIMSRFGSVLRLPLPSSTVRRRIIETALRGKASLNDEDWVRIIQATEGKDGRWLSGTLCGEAHRAVAHEAGIGGNVRAITFADFETMFSAESTAVGRASPTLSRASLTLSRASTSLCLRYSQPSSSTDAAPYCSDTNHVRSHLELSTHTLERKPLPFLCLAEGSCGCASAPLPPRERQPAPLPPPVLRAHC